MTSAHSSLSFAPHPRARTTLVAAVVLALSATLAACSPAVEEGPTGADTPPVEVTDEDADDDNADEAPTGGSPTTDDVGNATLRVDGVEFVEEESRIVV